MHREVASELAPVGRQPIRLVLAAPDSYGKSTLVSYALPIWALAYRRARCVLVGSSTRGAAGDLLRGVDRELKTNELLKRDFPHLALIERGSGASGSRASPPRDILVPGVARLSSFGPSSSLREMGFEGAPPDLIILDGYERDDDHAIFARHDCVRNWRRFERRVLDPFPHASVVVADALVRSGSLIQTMLSPEFSSSWSQRQYKAVETYPDQFDRWFEWARRWREDPGAASQWLTSRRATLLAGAQTLWPQHESFLDLMKLRADRGWVWFDRWRQGRPPEDHVVHHSILGDESDEMLARLIDYCVDDAGYARPWHHDQDGGPGILIGANLEGAAGPPPKAAPGCPVAQIRSLDEAHRLERSF